MNLIGIHKVTMEFLAKIIPGLEEIEPSILQRLYVEGTQRQSNLFVLFMLLIIILFILQQFINHI